MGCAQCLGMLGACGRCHYCDDAEREEMRKLIRLVADDRGCSCCDTGVCCVCQAVAMTDQPREDD